MIGKLKTDNKRTISYSAPVAKCIAAGALLVLSLLTHAGCTSVNDERIPYSPVRISFRSQGDWQTFGVGGAAETRSFILQERLPAGFPYTAMSATGFGGVLLVCDYDGEYRAFDLACPVECRSNIRIRPVLNDGEPRGECPVCGSTYDIFRYGGPLSGPAAQHRYGLTHYFVAPGYSGEFMTITN